MARERKRHLWSYCSFSLAGLFYYLKRKSPNFIRAFNILSTSQVLNLRLTDCVINLTIKLCNNLRCPEIINI